MKDIDTKRPRRLDLNAPLLTTRRSIITSATSLELSRASSLRGSSDRVPFSWEQSPGKPKNATTRQNVVECNKVLPLPKPPLIRWQEDDPTLTSHEGFEGDATFDNDDNDSSFSNAVDLFSLAGSLTTNERLDLESEINGNSYGALSPNFMIQRFLPAATALAASSLTALAANKDARSGNNSNKKTKKSCNDSKSLMAMYSSHEPCVPRLAGEAYSSSKGCGLQNFFPWRMKHKICGIKSPVKRVRYGLKPQLNSRNK